MSNSCELLGADLESRKPDLIILFSGGLESTYLLNLARRLNYQPLCVLVDYGQKHVKELEFAVERCKKEQLNYEIVKVVWPIHSSLTGDMEATYQNVSKWYVPARNLMFVSLAAGIAETRGIKTIWFGASFDDRLNNFPDCSQEWVVSINKTLEKSLSKKVQVLAPLLGLTKEMLFVLAKDVGIEKEEIFSGYGEQN